MRCESCLLLSSELPALPIAEAALRLDRCDECPLRAGSEPSASTVTTALVSKLHQAAVELRRQANKLRRAEYARRELSAEIEQSDARVTKLEALQAQSTREIEAELRGKIELVERQHAAITALSTPIIEVAEGVLVSPLVGDIDRERASDLTARLLAQIQSRRARYAILELTGVSNLDIGSMSQLLMIIQAIRLLGARSILCGIQAREARALSAMDMDLREIQTAATLHEAILLCRPAARR